MNGTVLQEFNELSRLPNRATQKLLRELNADDLALALTGADETTCAKFFANMSARAVAMLTEQIRSLGEVNREKADAARGTILSAYRKLVQAGEISPSHVAGEGGPTRIDPVPIVREPRTHQLRLDQLRTLFEEMADKAHKHGLFSLESDAEMIDDPVIKRGLELIVDGTDPRIVESALHDLLEEQLRMTRNRYETVIEGVLAVQKGDTPDEVRARMDARPS